MKWLPFFILSLLISCKSEKKSKLTADIQSDQVKSSNLFDLPFETLDDSGYFKGTSSEKIDEFEKRDASMLTKFLSTIIVKNDIILIDSQTLSHSVFINQRTKTRFDTLRNQNSIITSEYRFTERESQVIKLNGRVIKDYHWDGVDSTWENILDMEETSFRHFFFRGKEFYYIKARVMDGHYGSIHTIRYHLIYNPIAKSPDMFMTCRFEDMLFGDANGDDELDYLDFNNADFCTGVPLSDMVTIQLYSCNDKGQFILQKDKKGKPHFINGRTGDSFMQDSFNIKESYWPVPIRH